MLLLHREKHVKAYDRVGVFTSIIPIPHVTLWQHNSTSLLQEGIKIKYCIYVCISIHCINVILRIARKLLETRENIKIESSSFYHNLLLIFMGLSKKNPKWPFFKITNSQIFFVKISWLGPWVSRID